MIPTENDLFEAIDETWPAKRYEVLNGWLLREGAGGGKRVSAASLISTNADSVNVDRATDWMLKLGQDRLFMIRGSDTILDQQLANLNYNVIDPVIVLGRDLAGLSGGTLVNRSPTPTPEQAAVWRAGGLGADRLAVMNRAKHPKVCLSIDQSAVAFAAIHKGICMVHAVEVHADHRRQGLGKRIMLAAASWATEMGAKQISVLTVKQNKPALGLYRDLGFEDWGSYHYRILD